MRIDKNKLIKILEDREKTLKMLSFYRSMPPEVIYNKYLLFKKIFYPEYFKFQDTREHRQAVYNHILAYTGGIKTFTLLAYRSFGKTTDLKVLVIFFIACDVSQVLPGSNFNAKKKFFKFISDDKENSKQFVMDCYNLLANRKINQYFNIFGKELTENDDEDLKTEETKTAFVTNNGVKVYASTTNVNQRGSVQKANRPDFVMFDDIENKATVRSLVKTKAIWDKMEEAYTGLADDGACIYLGNYISRKRNIQKLVNRSKKDPERHKLMIVPILLGDKPQWESRFPMDRINQLMADVDDPQGEYMCEPSDLEDSYFKQIYVKNLKTIEPLYKDTEYEIYHRPRLGNRYVVALDPAGGNGGDYGAIVIIDITNKLKKKVCLVYKSRFMPPRELAELGLKLAIKYNNAFYIFENNYNGQVIANWIKDQGYNNYYKTIVYNEDRDKETEKLGFETNSKTKPIILDNLHNELRFATLDISSPYIKSQLEDFPREYAETIVIDEELGHFDVLMALSIALIGAEEDLGDYKVTDNKDPIINNWEEDIDKSTDDHDKNIVITDIMI